MTNIKFSPGKLDSEIKLQLSAGFERHSQAQQAPDYECDWLNWTLVDEQGKLIAALTGQLLWDWLYIDELWVDEVGRGTGIGKQLMQTAESYAIEQQLSGLWLWTQSWQAPGFYLSLGYSEFTRFEDFPKGYSRIGLRKPLGR
ncbi:GNAT family N-acetyltransferase [Shewanella waksmanii]|uniref:GNAT family N-acetyltransferase n=1 Tax=Shewanella waksmanii TaxID=213783 RepID=UPI003734DCE2